MFCFDKRNFYKYPDILLVTYLTNTMQSNMFPWSFACANPVVYLVCKESCNDCEVSKESEDNGDPVQRYKGVVGLNT